MHFVVGQVEVQNWLKKILWSRFLYLASALAQRCCRKDGKVPLLRPLEPTVPPTPETSWVLAAACETQQIREAFCSDSAESVHSSSVVSFHKQNPVVPVAHDLKGITRSFFFSSLHVSPLHTHLCL